MKKIILLMCICLVLAGCQKEKTAVVLKAENLTTSTSKDFFTKDYGKPTEETELNGYMHYTFTDVTVIDRSGTLIAQYDGSNNLTSIAWEHQFANPGESEMNKALDSFLKYYNNLYGSPSTEDPATNTYSYITSDGVLAIHAENSGIAIVKTFVAL